VLLHGLMGYSWSWRFNMQPLGQYFTVYAPDLPGCGFSQRADCLTGSLEDDAERLLKFLDRLGLEDFYLLGTSRGGGVAIVLASLLAQHGMQHRIRRLILSAPINPWSRFGQLRTRLLATGLGRLYTLHGARHTPFLVNYYFRKLYGDTSRIAPGSIEGYKAGLVPPRSFHHLYKTIKGWHDDLKQVEAELPQLQQIPTLLLWGERDSAVYLSSAYELQKRLPNSTVLVMKSAGHLPYEEAPEDFNSILCDFHLRHQPRTPLESATTDETHAVDPAAALAESNPVHRNVAG
jgi:pimeloyl-ACP methyl ester carboxylesterase